MTDSDEEADVVMAQRQAVRHGDAAPISNGAESMAAGKAAGNIHLPSDVPETIELAHASKEAQERQEQLIAEVETRRRLRQTVVPTDPGEVKQTLRQLGEPVTLFGEREMERRERLRKIMATMDDEEAAAALPEGTFDYVVEEAIRHREIFYTEGIAELLDARKEIARFSLARAAERLARTKRKRESLDEDEMAEAAAVVDMMKHVVNQSSEFGDERPVSGCAFSPEGSLLASVSWAGLLKLWDASMCAKQLTVKAHENRITGVAWHPAALLEMSAEGVNLATGAADNTARLWSREGSLLRTLDGHTDRLGRVAFHPMGRHLGTTSFDQTWRLWDCETGAALLEQEGHSRALYALAFHPDGSLAASGGLDAIGRVWDVRTGRSILVLEGHVNSILALDFSPSGYYLASGSEDHTVRVWDLRKKRSLYTIPAHKSLVSQVRFEPNDGATLLTAGYDNLAKLWSAKNFRLVRTLAGHENKVMGADLSPDGSGVVATTSYDRTVKFWWPEAELRLDVDA